jgi:hypothetical protein
MAAATSLAGLDLFPPTGEISNLGQLKRHPIQIENNLDSLETRKRYKHAQVASVVVKMFHSCVQGPMFDSHESDSF